LRAAPVVLALLFVGCTIEEEDFPDAYGRAVCARLPECQRSDYDDRYEARSECIDEWAEFADSIIDLGDTFGTEYSSEGVRECLDNIHQATCSEFSDFQFECTVMQ